MTQVLSVDAASVGVRASSAAPVAADVFAAALLQAGVDLDAATPQTLFQMPALASASGRTLEACLAVALENLAAGNIPKSVLDALTARLGIADQVPDASDKDPDEASDLGELVGLLMAAVPAEVDLQVPSGDLVSDNAVPSAAPVIEGATQEPQVPAASLPPLPDVPVAPTPVLTDDVTSPTPDLPMPVVGRDAPPVADAVMTAVPAPEVPLDVEQPREVLEVPSQKAPPSTPVVPNAPAAALSPAPAVDVAVAALPPDLVAVREGGTAVAAPAAVAPESDLSADKGVELVRAQDAPSVAQPLVPMPADASVEAVVAPEAFVERPREVQPVVVDKALDSLHQAESLAPKSSVVQADSPAPALGADQERMIARIAGAIVAAEQSGRSTVRVRLYPPELGTVRIEVSSVRGAITARIEASSTSTQTVLQSNVAALRSDLRQAGIDVRALEVQYRNSAFSFGPQQQRQSRSGYEPQERSNRAPAGFHHEAETAANQPALVAAGEIDLLL